MSRHEPRPDCRELLFAEGHAMDDPGEVALEDYARVLTRAAAAEAWRDGALVKGVHLCGLQQAPSMAAVRDVEDFARGLAGRSNGGGLGWS